MGGWYDALKKPENALSRNPQNPQNHTQVSFGGFGGSPSEHIAEFFAVSHPAAWDAEDWQMAFEERAAILEYDGGFTRSEAERLARIEVDALRKTSGI